jgi:hypothetical protein
MKHAKQNLLSIFTYFPTKGHKGLKNLEHQLL